TDLGKARRPGAVAKPGIVHPPDFYCAIIPHVGIGGCPPIRAIRVPIKTQDVDFGVAFFPGALRFCRPQFQFAILERNGFANRITGINWHPRWEENQMVRQMTKQHDEQIYDSYCEQAPWPTENSWAHICLAARGPGAEGWRFSRQARRDGPKVPGIFARV